MHDDMDWDDLTARHAYSPEARYVLQQRAIARARLERARAVRGGLLWLIAAVRRPIVRLVARRRRTGVTAGAAPGRA